MALIACLACLTAGACSARSATLLVTAAIGAGGVANAALAARPPAAARLVDHARGLEGPWRVRGYLRTTPRSSGYGSVVDAVIEELYVDSQWRGWPLRVRLSVDEPPAIDTPAGTRFETFLALRADRPPVNPHVRSRQPLRATGNDLRASLKSYRQLRRGTQARRWSWRGVGHRAHLRLRVAIDDLFGARAPFVRAVLLGERGDLDAALRNRYTRAGLAHVLAISGLHLGLLLAAVFFICRILGMSPSMAAAACLAALPLFLGVTVVRAALARAALMAAYFFAATAAGLT